MILVPLSKKSSRGDQIENANYFKKLGIAEVINEENLDSLEQTLDKVVKNLNNFKFALNKQHFKNGLDDLIKEILKAEKR